MMPVSRSAGGSDCAGLLECRDDFANDRKRLADKPPLTLLSSSFAARQQPAAQGDSRQRSLSLAKAFLRP
jgi:hypothetical protein